MRNGSLLLAGPIKTKGRSACLTRSREIEGIESPPESREPAPSRTAPRNWFRNNRWQPYRKGVRGICSKQYITHPGVALFDTLLLPAGTPRLVDQQIWRAGRIVASHLRRPNGQTWFEAMISCAGQHSAGNY